MRQGYNASNGAGLHQFQYRKRYEVTCDYICEVPDNPKPLTFQYRKRYEVTCDSAPYSFIRALPEVSIPQAV